MSASGATTLGLLGAGAAGAGVGAGALYAAPPDRQLAYTAAFSRLATIKQVRKGSHLIASSVSVAKVSAI